jgi:hypothetical protein
MNQIFLLTKKTNIIKHLSSVLITIFIFGCGTSTKFIKTGKLINAKSNDCYIEVFNSKIPERKYEELGILESEGNYGYDNLEDVLPELKKKACSNGGDAIIIKNIQKYFEDSNEKIYVTATVIKWLD